jgi:type VI secretion system protein ImpB
MANESTQHKLDRTRKPRVQITYDVEKGDATETKELPFVVGVLSDLSGQRAEPLDPLKERAFKEVSRDNFNDYLKEQAPRFAGKVENELVDDPDAQLSVDITFKSMKDFEPEAIVEQVPVLKELLEIRQRLKSLQSRVTSNGEVEELVRDIIAKDERRREIAKELGLEKLEQAPAADGDPKGGK